MLKLAKFKGTMCLLVHNGRLRLFLTPPLHYQQLQASHAISSPTYGLTDLLNYSITCLYIQFHTNSLTCLFSLGNTAKFHWSTCIFITNYHNTMIQLAKFKAPMHMPIGP